MSAHQKEIEGGWVYVPLKKARKSYLSDCLSIAGIENGLVINKDGSIAVGFEVDLFEEESLDEDGFLSVISEFSAACKRLPVGTVIQKLDIYDEEIFTLRTSDDSLSNLPYFHRKTLEYHDQKKFLKHRCFIYLLFFSKSINPVSSFLAMGNSIFKNPFLKLDTRREIVQQAAAEFVTAMPQEMKLVRLGDEQNKTLLYQYMSLTFNREPLNFESSIAIEEDSIALGGYLKSVRMKTQSENVYAYRKNNLGLQGVTSPFVWNLTHFADFPHMICQHIEIVNDAKFRKSKSSELRNSAQLKLGSRARELAEDEYDNFLELEKELQEHDIQIVKLSMHVLVWHADKAILGQRTSHVKSAFGKMGIEADEEKEETIASFLASAPGATGFTEGMYMPLETAVAHLNFVTPKKGDAKGILLASRHGSPIYYDPFKYSLDNQHAFVFGPTGSGKSFFNGKMIKDRFYAGHTMIVIDSGGTYRRLFEALGGTYIEYRPDKPLKFNPFLFKKVGTTYIPAPDKIAFLVNFIAKIWKGDLEKNPLSELEYALLSKFLTKYYKALSTGEIPSLVGFCTWLKGHIQAENVQESLFHLENFLLILEPFTEGIYKDHFNAPKISYPEDERLICFELEAVKSDSKLYPLVVKVLFDYVLELVDTQAEQIKFIDIEEGWTMLDDSSKDYIEAFFRKGRKTNTAIRIITQNVDEIRHSKIAGAMKNNAATFILLYNDKESVRGDIAGFLGMNAFDMEKYASLRRKDSYVDGYREVFIKEMDKSSVWRVGISLYEHGILTSRPDERNAITRLIRQAEGDIELAVARWVNGVLEKK